MQWKYDVFLIVSFSLNPKNHNVDEKPEYDISIIMVSHDLELAKKYADKVILLDREVIKEGAPDDVFKSLEFKNRFGELA